MDILDQTAKSHIKAVLFPYIRLCSWIYSKGKHALECVQSP